MIINKDAYISEIVCHRFCTDDNNNIISNQQTDIRELDNGTLKKILLDPFEAINEVFEFVHEVDISLNVLRKIANEYWENEDLLSCSKDIFIHLKKVATHPNIKDGDLVFVKYEDVQIENSYYEENGYVVAVVDNTNRGIEAQYWMDDFLHVRQRKDGYANTQNAMAMAKNFVTKALPEQFEVSKADQIDLLNRSLEFFKENDTFEMEEFANEVIEQPEVIESFRQYKRSFEEENDVVIDDSFDISDYAFRRQQRSYKRVIRLDRKIQIIIDGNRDHVEQGEDERGKYYKVYYSEEE